MAKFYGVVGYAEITESSKGVWTEIITEKNSFGNIIRNTTKTQAGAALTDNINVNIFISIVAYPYATQHILDMRYVSWLGILWKITNIEVQYPRLLLTIGGVYNAQS
jgi:hypothetical protein